MKTLVDESRLIAIETKLAYQDDLVSKLNDVVTDHQSQITKLEQLCGSLMGRVKSLSEAMPMDQPQNERPPHY